MKWYRGKQKIIRGDNTGSTIITVLVTMTFLTVLASILLYLSLINLQMKKMDKAGKINFYSAEAVMNEVRAVVQQAASDAIKTAYTNVLISYNTVSRDDQSNTFKTMFINGLDDYIVNSEPLFSWSGAIMSYHPDVLQAALALDTTISSISGSGVVQQIVDGGGSTTAVILKDITVRYIKNGYETTISSDIRIQAPDLPYTSTTSRQTAIPDFAIVAKGTLGQPAGNGIVSVFGNVYAGGVTIGGSGDTFNVQNAAYFVSGGPVTVNGGALSLNLNSSLWAGDIKLDTGGRITIAGDAYVANDLNLYGSLTQAVLTGRYFGYGDSTTNPAESSAIIINGKNTVLDMSALRALMLAGHSFVNFGTPNGYVLMGESLSVKSNQLAYLVPDNCLKSGFANPYQYTGAAPDTAILQSAVLLDQKIMNNKTLTDYGITSAASNIEYIHKSVGTTNLIYFCLKFPTPEAANAYFKDYYSANGPQVQKYLDVYSNGILLAGSSTKSLAGEAFTFNGSVLGPIVDATNVPAATKAEIKNSYANLCVTLSRTESAVGVNSAYDYFINGGDVAAVPAGSSVAYPSEGDAKVVVTNGNYVMNAGQGSSVHIIIASGDVTVSGNYTGLILAGGNVTLLSGAAVTANRAAVADALQELTAVDGAGSKYYQYFKPEIISPMNISSSATGQSGVWDMNRLVVNENWKKNET